LSLQAHLDSAQARAGFERESSLDLPPEALLVADGVSWRVTTVTPAVQWMARMPGIGTATGKQ
jgi:hypothetical protein